MTRKFGVGMLVRLVRPEGANVAVGRVLVAYDANGDIHVQFPDPEGTGVFPPEELEIVEPDRPNR